MKVIVDEKSKTQEVKYPFIGKSIRSNLIALFIEKGKGVVLEPGENDMWSLGSYCDDFFMDNFKPFGGRITLENE